MKRVATILILSLFCISGFGQTDKKDVSIGNIIRTDTVVVAGQGKYLMQRTDKQNIFTCEFDTFPKKQKMQVTEYFFINILFLSNIVYIFIVLGSNANKGLKNKTVFALQNYI